MAEGGPRLADAGRRVLAPDLVGAGGSTAPPAVPRSLANQAAWLLDLLDALRIQRALVVGYGNSGGVAQRLTARAPQHVCGPLLLGRLVDEVVNSAGQGAPRPGDGPVESAAGTASPRCRAPRLGSATQPVAVAEQIFHMAAALLPLPARCDPGAHAKQQGKRDSTRA